MTTWLLTVWLVLADHEKIWLETEYSTEAECRQWQQFYQEYPFRPICQAIQK